MSECGPKLLYLPMAAPRKSYILAPDFDYTPDGDVGLGVIISDACFPAISLISKPAPNSLDGVEGRPRIQSSQVKYGWHDSREITSSQNVGLLGKFLAMVELGVNADGDKEEWESYKCEELSTQFIVPEPDYLKQCAKEAKVKNVMEIRKGGLGKRKAVYMITGIKIVKGLEVATGFGKHKGFDSHASGDVTEPSGGTIPVGAEVNAGVTRGNEREAGFTIPNEVIFAYQLLKLQYTGPKGKEDVKSKPYLKGAFLSIEDQGGQKPQELGELNVVNDVGGRGQEDLEEEVDTEDVDLEAVELEDDGQQVACVVVRK